MRISDWSSDVCSSDLFCSAPRNSVAGLRHSGPKTAALPVHKPSLYQPVPVCAGIHSMRDTTVNAAFLKRPGIWSRSHYLDRMNQIGRAHVRTPVTNAQLVCRLLHETKKINHYIY